MAPENPVQNVFGTQRINVTPRQVVVDSKGTVYAITLSGLSVVPPTPAGAGTRPAIALMNDFVEWPARRATRDC